MYKTLIIFLHKCAILQCQSGDLVRRIYRRGAGRAARAVLLAGDPPQPPCSWGHWARGPGPWSPPTAAPLWGSRGFPWDREQPDLGKGVPARGRGVGTGWSAEGPFQPKPFGDSVTLVLGCTQRPQKQDRQECLVAFLLP